MIDIHCHILPGFDDGALDMNEARLMAAMAADDGVTEIIATPHIIWGETDISKQMKRIREAVNVLQEELRAARIPIKIIAGAEVLCCGDVPEPEQLSCFPCMGKTRYALVEFRFEETYDYMERWMSALQMSGICSIIAHPERYTAVQKDRLLPQRWVDLGYRLQLNKGSFQGQFGMRAKKTAHRIMKDHLASFIASDAHNTSGRTPRMTHIYSELSGKYGRPYLSSIMRVKE